MEQETNWTLSVGQCEWSQYNNDHYTPIEVHAVSDKMAIISEGDSKQFGVYLSEHEFRPIDRQRRTAIEEMTRRFAFFSHPDVPWEGLFTQMYDAGLRFSGPLSVAQQRLIKNKIQRAFPRDVVLVEGILDEVFKIDWISLLSESHR